MANDERDQITTSNDQVSNNSGTLGGMTDKLSSAVGGTQGSENAQSYIGKGIEAVQQSVFGKGEAPGTSDEGLSGGNQEKQDAHAAVDQAHPEKISEFMRDKYMSRTEEQMKEEGRG